MASAIDPTKPVFGSPTTESVRDNFEAAKNEIEELQEQVPAFGTGALILKIGGSTTGITTSVSTVSWAKMGSICFVTGAVRLTSKGSGSGDVTIEGLPFASGIVPDELGVLLGDGNGFASGVGALPIMSVAQNTSIVALQKIASGVKSSITNADIQNDTVIRFSGWYPIDV